MQFKRLCNEFDVTMATDCLHCKPEVHDRSQLIWSF